MANCYVYILECHDGTLYTGYTVDVAKRVDTHNAGLGAKYTRARLPVTLKYQELCESKSAAMKREIQIKKLSRIQKLQLIRGEADALVHHWDADR
ncbi:GIY-YIG nuclease family protein [Aliicoccus persicus]|uniref:Putative endonuclease n=1 Tax=Aliicoccus persicus TaxID=930138 RepID=A0A662Z3M1_9STAP|nr:GIY-YIG nuclease family protein [Aliicoccus persicus]SEW05611.1 putative endonuclease [Aliicoccus persicus]